MCDNPGMISTNHTACIEQKPTGIDGQQTVGGWVYRHDDICRVKEGIGPTEKNLNSLCYFLLDMHLLPIFGSSKSVLFHWLLSKRDRS